MYENGIERGFTREELHAEGFTDSMIEDMLGEPFDEIAVYYGAKPTPLWDADGARVAKHRAIQVWLAEHEQPPREVPEKYIAPEGFFSVKQLRAMGFSCGQLDRLLPQPARMCVEGEDFTTRVWRAEDVEHAMASNNFTKKKAKRERQRRDEAWEAIRAGYVGDAAVDRGARAV